MVTGACVTEARASGGGVRSRSVEGACYDVPPRLATLIPGVSPSAARGGYDTCRRAGSARSRLPRLGRSASGTNLSKTMARPPGTRARMAARRHARPSGTTLRTKWRMTTSKLAGSTGGLIASPRRSSTERPGSGSLLRARSSIAGERSTPTARTPSGGRKEVLHRAVVDGRPQSIDRPIASVGHHHGVGLTPGDDSPNRRYAACCT